MTRDFHRRAAKPLRVTLAAGCAALCGGLFALSCLGGVPPVDDADVICENGVCRLAPKDRGGSARDKESPAEAVVPAPDRIAQGAMSEDAFVDFLRGRAHGDDLAGKSLVWIVLLSVLGGLALNLTPCVLPMIPVNLMVIGASVRRGFLYGLGQMASFGVLGLLAALGGVAFGTVQSTPWFNGVVSLLLALFSLSLFGAFSLDFTRFRKGLGGGAFVLGMMSAGLAGACVAPILASVLLLTARLYAEGRTAGLALPFAVGFGLALPWPFLGAGLRILPKPGAWMRWVNRLFAILLAGLAVHYGILAARGAFPATRAGTDDLTVDGLLSSRILSQPRKRPVLIVCHASWCKNCAAMERLIATSRRIRAELAGMDVVRLDAEDPNELAKLPGFDSVRGLPAFAIYASR